MLVADVNRPRTSAPPIAILGVPFDNVTTSETVSLIEQMVTSKKPHYLATANVDFLVQALHDVELRRILLDAHMVLCDGTPLVWASRMLGNPLPERVAGSDLVPLLIKLSAEKNYRLFFLGGTPESTSKAVANLHKQYPTLEIAGHYSPPFSKLLEMDHEEINRRIQEAKPDMLFVCFGCPKQEKWISMHYRSLGVPVSVGVGATIDFIAGTSKRAPKIMQKSGTEWLFRLGQEPRRLFRRYSTDLTWFSREILKQWMKMQRLKKSKDRSAAVSSHAPEATSQRIKMPRRLDVETVRRDSLVWEEALANGRHCILELQDVEFIDSTGIGLLIRLQKKARVSSQKLILLAPTQPVQSAIKMMRLQDFFSIARDNDSAKKLLETAAQEATAVRTQTSYFKSRPSLFWQGEVTAANAQEVWKTTEGYIATKTPGNADIKIDLSALQFIDSTGVGLMVKAKKNASQQGIKLSFTAPQPNVRNVLRLAHLESVLLEEAK